MAFCGAMEEVCRLLAYEALAKDKAGNFENGT